MILLKIDDKIQFTPESDIECFNLGGLAIKVSCAINLGRDLHSNNQHLKSVEIKQSDLLTYLFK